MSEPPTQHPCPDCGYDRSGLEPDRPCPECGYAQPADEIVVWGRIIGMGLDRNLNIRTTLGLLLAITVIFSFSFVDERIKQPIVIAAGVLGVIAWLAWHQYHSGERRTLPGPGQLRLSPRGFAIRNGIGEVTWRRWERKWRASIHRNFAGQRHEICIEHNLIGPLDLDRMLRFRPTTISPSRLAEQINGLIAEHGK